MDKEKIFRALWDFYRKRVLPLEIAYQYEHFEGKTMMTEADFMSKPMVLLLGPYSVGKTSFIRSLIKCDFPGAPRLCKSMHRPISNGSPLMSSLVTRFLRNFALISGQNIGPEPTTDKFTAVMYGRREQAVPGHRAVLQVRLDFDCHQKGMPRDILTVDSQAVESNHRNCCDLGTNSRTNPSAHWPGQSLEATFSTASRSQRYVSPRRGSCKQQWI